MTKRDFIALADALLLAKPGGNLDPAAIYQAKRAQWDATVMRIADVCEASNAGFNRSLWFDYLDGKRGPSGGKR